MHRRTMREGLIVAIETALLLLFAATWGIPGGDRPKAAAEPVSAPLTIPFADRLDRPPDRW